MRGTVTASTCYDRGLFVSSDTLTKGREVGHKGTLKSASISGKANTGSPLCRYRSLPTPQGLPGTLNQQRVSGVVEYLQAQTLMTEHATVTAYFGADCVPFRYLFSRNLAYLAA